MPEWLDVVEETTIEHEGRTHWIPSGWYLHLRGDYYHPATGEGADIDQFRYPIDVVRKALATGNLKDCSTDTYRAFETSLAECRKAQKSYFAKRTGAALSWAKTCEKQLDTLLLQLTHHEETELLSLATRMRDSQREYFAHRGLQQQFEAMDLEKQVDSLLRQQPTQPA
jgi:hypothetical protein